jgi:hypothetical protein
MSDGEMSELGISVATASATTRERQVALEAVVFIAVVFGASAPFANTELPRLDSFIPTVEGVIAVSSVVTAALLFGQFLFVRSLALLVLGGAYFFTGTFQLTLIDVAWGSALAASAAAAGYAVASRTPRLTGATEA